MRYNKLKDFRFSLVNFRCSLQHAPIIVLMLLGAFLVKNGLCQDIVINEFCSLNTEMVDEDNDTPDWIEVFNPTLNAINLGNYYFSDDTSDFYKWKFPEIHLAPSAHILVFASGKDKKDLSYLSNLINQGDTFAYAIGSEDIPVDWKMPSFSDSSWQYGASGFGYGDGDDETIIDNGTISVYVRKSFFINDVSSIKKLLLHLDYDDGFVAYVNGNEIARSNLGEPGSDVAYSQEADNYIEPLIVNGFVPELFEIDDVQEILMEGENILAIQIHNNSPTSSDLTLIPFLSVETTLPNLGNPMPNVLEMSGGGSLHTNFKISSDGEQVFLSNSSGEIVDKTDSIVLPSGVSFGRALNNISEWRFFAEPTPGYENNTTAYVVLGNSLVSFSPIGGKYHTSKQVSLSALAEGEIYYTTDGSIPTIESNKYTGTISIDKTTVLKAIVVSENVLPLSPSVHTYIIENRSFKLPVISLSSDPDNFFDYNTGILEMGPNADPGIPHFGANFWQDWERPVHVEYFNNDGIKVFETQAGTKVFGGWSRANDQKSLSLFARKAYGNSSFDYPFFKERNIESYKSLVLRNSGNDNGHSHFRDAMMTGLVRNVDIDRQAYQPAIVYINGEYWGILNLREKINEDFLEQNHDGVDADEVDILERDGWEVIEGSSGHYRSMINYIDSYGVEDNEDYNYVSSLMNIDNFMDYQIAQIYYDNQDWPGNNIKFWRPHREAAKWRWILFDTDFGFGIGFGTWGSGYHVNTLAFALAPNGGHWPNPPWSTFLLRSFVENKKFVKDFANRFADRLNHDFEPSRVINFIDSLQDNIYFEVAYHRNRWENLFDFNEEVNYFYEFAEERPYYLREYIASEFSLGKVVDLQVDVNDKKKGNVQVNTIVPESYPWKGKYFKDNPVPIIAVAEPGYEFSHWEGIESNSAYIELKIPSDGINLKAHFKESNKDYNAIVINEIKYQSSEVKNSNDWVELYNTTNAKIDISGWVLHDSNPASGFTFPLGTVIEPKRYLVVCKSLNDFNEQNNDVGNVVGNFSFGLNSSFDELTLLNKQGVVVDSLNYFNVAPWPVASNDQTISLYTPYSDNSMGYNWQASVGEGTPGKGNDHFTDVREREEVFVSETQVVLYPNPVVENALLKFNNQIKQNVSVDLYDLKGSLVTNLFSQVCLEGQQRIDLKIANSLLPGVYFLGVSYENGERNNLKFIKM